MKFSLFLIDNRNRVIEKAEFMKAVWPDSFVEEGNLSQNIFLLRKTLGDGQDGQRYILTVPGVGYRFVPEVAEQEEQAPAQSPADDWASQRGPEPGAPTASALRLNEWPCTWRHLFWCW